MRPSFSLISLFCLVCIATPCAAGEKIRLQLAWNHQFQFAGYYAAVHKEFYKAAGLDVTLIEGGQGKFAREEVLKGAAQYGVAGAELVLHRRDGDPFVVLAPIFQHSPSVLLVRKDSGISTLQDLIGKRVMLLPGKKDADILAAFLNEGIPLEAIMRLDQTYDLDHLVRGRTDAVSAYLTNEPYFLEQRGIAPGIISPRTYGVDFYADCLFTTEKEIRSHPERTRAFLNASLRGWEYAMDHPEETADLILERYPVRKSRDHLLYEAASIRKIMLPHLVQIGHMNPGRWRHIVNTYAKLGMIDPDFSIEGFLYDRQNDTARLKQILFISVLAGGLSGLSALFLYRFNRKLAREVKVRIQAEADLKASEERFNLAMAHTNDGIYDWNLTTNEIYYSPGWKRMLGYADHELENKFSVWETLTDPDDVKASWAMIEQVIEKRRDRFEKEFRMRHKDGRWVDILSRAKVTFDENGRAVRVVGTHVDISERKKIERDLVQQKERAERYLKLAAVMFIGLDTDGNVNLVNQKACSVLGYEEAEIMGLNWLTTFVPKSGREDFKDVFLNLMSGKVDPVRYHENPVISKSGEEKLIAWTNTCLTDTGGRITGVLSSGEDISEKRMLKARLLNARKMESIGRLAGGIAHEFNNILSIIMGNNELIADQLPPSSPCKENTAAIQAAVKRAGDVVRQLLTFSRKDNALREPMDIRTVVENAVKLIRSSTPANIQIHQDIEERTAPVKANAAQVSQIVINLCANAADAMLETGGTISVGLANTILKENQLDDYPDLPPGRYVKLTVSDTGSGMDRAILDNIFDPYFTTKEVGKGSGIGLSVVHGIVERHCGAIRVDSAPGRGSRFTILLPACKTAAPEAETPVPRGSARILFVDDEPAISLLAERLLTSLGYFVTAFTDPRDALAAFEAAPHGFDLVMSDMAMPGMTGDRLLTRIMDIRPDIPTVICTGYSAHLSEKEAAAQGVTAFVMKPLDKSELAAAVADALSGKSDAGEKLKP